MKSKFEILPNELKKQILSSFKNNSKELSAFALTNIGFYSLIQPQRLVESLLRHIAWGNQSIAKKMLIVNPELMIKKGKLVDPSGRYFENISPFEFVLWALDVRYMATMMFMCLRGETGLEIAKTLEKQYNIFDLNGVTYNLHKQIVNQKHVDFSILINSLQNYINNYNKWSENQSNDYWRLTIGGAQRMLPPHVIQHYCDPDTPFYPTPNFTAEQLSRTIDIKNWDNERQIMSWTANCDSSVLVLGKDYALAASSLPAHGWVRGPKPAWVQPDLLAIQKLYNVRLKDFIMLKSTLKDLFHKIQEEKSSNDCVIF